MQPESPLRRSARLLARHCRSISIPDLPYEIRRMILQYSRNDDDEIVVCDCNTSLCLHRPAKVHQLINKRHMPLLLACWLVSTEMCSIPVSRVGLRFCGFGWVQNFLRRTPPQWRANIASIRFPLTVNVRAAGSVPTARYGAMQSWLRNELSKDIEMKILLLQQMEPQQFEACCEQ